MGPSDASGDDIARLTAVLDLLQSRELTASEVQIGALRISFAPPRFPSPPSEASEGVHFSENQLKERRVAEWEATMYASSEGDAVEVPLG